RRSHAPGHPGEAFARRRVGQDAGGTIRAVPARDLEAPAGARAGRADRAGTAGAVATASTPSGATPRGRELGRAVSPALAGQLRAAGRRAQGTPGHTAGAGTGDRR